MGSPFLVIIFCTIFATYLIPKRLVSDGDPVVPLIVLLGTFCGVAVAFFMFSALEGKNDPTGFTSYTEQFALKDFSTRDGELFFNGTKGEFTHCKLQNVSVLVKKDLSGTFIEAKSSFGSTLMGTADSTIIFVASESEKRDWEKELLGLFISDHPLKDYEKQLGLDSGVTRIKDLTSGRGSSQIKIGGIVTKMQKIMTKNGEPMVFSWLEDLTSKIEVVVFPGVLKDNPDAFQENKIIIVSGRVNDRDGVPKLLCESVRPIATLS